MKCRKNFKRLTSDERARFATAVVKLKNQSLHDSILMPGMMSRYDDYPMVHMNAMMSGNAWAHGNSSFLPWHRELLFRFEKDLQAIDPSLTIPYWDWTREQTAGDAGFPFRHDCIGVDGTDAQSDRVMRESGAPSPYPYPFDPDAWVILMKDSSGDPDYLVRAFGERADAPDLPENDVVVTGVGSTFRQAIGAASYGTLRSRSEDQHNLVHRWVGGNMLDMSSPNDPVFFMHHAQIDRMWSLWQYKHPGSGTPKYVADAGGTAPGTPLTFNAPGDIAPWSGSATPNEMIDGHAIHGTGVWYDTDLPEIEASAPSLDFIDIPEGLTSFKAVRFKIKGCRSVRFRITGAPSGSFGVTPMGLEFQANPVESDDFFYGYVWVQFTSVAGTVPNSSVNIHAYIIDDEGYYAAAEGDEFPLGDFSVTLSATTVPRENNSVALVLDRSGSMAAPAGGSSTRTQLLANALGVFKDLMLPADELAVVTFDDVVAAPIPMQAVSTAPPLSTVDLSPRNATWIGGGIQQGAAELTSATHTNKSVLVLTDGNENVHPYIGELPAGTVTNRTYAIGFGLPGEVSDAALQAITSNTNGDLIITGHLSSEEQRFQLTKYFVQVLASVTNAQVLLDPKGKLYLGSKDSIPFKVTDADVYLDAIAVCPVPQFLDFVLQTPGGQVIRPTSAEPNVKHIMGRQVRCYRMVLPALAADAPGSHSGTWHASLALVSEAEIARLARTEKLAHSRVDPRVDGFLPYSFLVHATSNIAFAARTLQKSLVPGSTVRLLANLSEYDVPMSVPANVWAEVAHPDQRVSTVQLMADGDGRYSASFATALAGLYTFRMRAEGYSSKGAPFTREKTVTAGVYYGGRHESVPSPSAKDVLCGFLQCLLGGRDMPTAKARFGELDLDLERLIACMHRICRPHPGEFAPVKAETKPQVVSQIKFRKAVPAKPSGAPAIATSTTLRKHLHRLEKERPTMFMQLSSEEGNGHEEEKGSKDKHRPGRRR
jgi:hypothetical protein